MPRCATDARAAHSNAPIAALEPTEGVRRRRSSTRVGDASSRERTPNAERANERTTNERMETFQRNGAARDDPWASMRMTTEAVQTTRGRALGDGDDDGDGMRDSPLTTRRRRKLGTTKRANARTRRNDASASEEDAAGTCSEGEEEAMTLTTTRRTTRGNVKFKAEAENASLTAMAKKSASAATTTPGKKVVVHEEVEKINARATNKPLKARTNEKGMREGESSAVNSSNESFATASIDPWGAPLVVAVERKSRQVSSGPRDSMTTARKKRAQEEVPMSPSRYESVNPRVVTATKRSKEARSPVRQLTAANVAFGSPTAILSATNGPLRADTDEGRAYVCPGPELPPKGECYLGMWRGEERARLLAYEACVQSCLEGSLGSFTAQRRFDMDTCLFFLNERCAELRRAFGLDNVLVGVHSDEGRSPEPKTRVTPEKMRRAESTRGVGPGAGGVRWAAITIAVMDVEIIDRGLKKFTKGWDPREHGWQRPTEARGQHMIVRTEGGPGSAEVCAEIAVKQPAVRLALGPGDKEFIIEVPLKSDGSKVATAQIALDQLCKRAEAGVVELPLELEVEMPATEQAAAYTHKYEKGTVSLSAVFEAAVGAGLMSAPPGAGTAPDRSMQGWAEASHVLTPQAAYDFALGAALRALGFTRRRLTIHGQWQTLLDELAKGHGVSETYTSLRYIQHLLAVATPTADCLSLIRDHLKLALRRQADGSLGSTEGQMLNGIRSAVMTLVCVCLANYKSLDESEFRGITESIPPIVPAPALDVSLELFKALQRDPSSSGALEILTENITSAARACFKKNKAVLVNEKRKLAVNNKDLVTQLYVAIGELCVALKNELETDRVIQSASEFPGGFSLPALSADMYCTEVAATFKDALDACPPSGPPSTDVLDCIERSCNLQASASIEEKDGQRMGAPKLDTRKIFQPHIDGWITAAQRRLEVRCVAVLTTKGIVGPAIEEAYIAMNDALHGFERIVTRWPDQALALERVLVSAERLLIKQIAESVEHLHVGIANKEDGDGKSSKPTLRAKGNWMNKFGSMKDGVASVAKRTQQVSQQVSKRLSRGDAAHNGIPPALAAALNALKSMEIRRADEEKVGQRLMTWAVNGGSAGADELGHGLTETLGELRAHYNGYLRRAVHGVYSCGPSLREKLCKAKPKQEVEPVVAPVLAYIDGIKVSLDKKLPQRRAMVGVLRGLWDSIGAECLAFYEEDLRTNSTWHKRVLASAAVDIVSDKIQDIIREFLVHDVHDKDVEPPSSVAKLQAFSSSNTRDSVQLY